MGAIRRQLPHCWHSKPGVSRLVCRARNQEKIPIIALKIGIRTEGRKEAQFPVVRQAMEKDLMIKDFNVSEKGHGSYWLLGILRWVMVLIFVSFGIQKLRPSPQTALHYTFPTVRSFRGCLSSGSEARLMCSVL
jgi:hypothetical protein